MTLCAYLHSVLRNNLATIRFLSIVTEKCERLCSQNTYTVSPQLSLKRYRTDGKVSVSGLEGSKSDSTKACMLNLKTRVRSPPAGVLQMFDERVPARVLSSSSDDGSKLLSSSQNSHRAASKWDVNVTKLNQ
ncbi:hypothetical protein AVEN_55847-1 [Araneus ventricosus]|uniref:Uncharacterized protein n=1 Tax=Araneus ventricosus TaxID=182803 RepID=A0A4Y2CMW5_ARAVE|nr:hypothetical protein AVEN_55847-1 [Araneus ventricosus]